ncbi:MAG: glycosyltransferase family 4 protein [Candidatus Thermoplasmatota archaeon]
MRNMRVLMLAPEFLPVRGGVGNYIAEISKRVPHDVEMYVVTPRQGTNESEHAQINGNEDFVSSDNVHVVYLGEAQDYFFGNFPFQVNCGFELRRMIRDLRIDIVHSHSAMPDYFVSPDSTGVPFLTTIHTTLEGHKNALKASGSRFTELSMHERFALLLAPALKRFEDAYYSKNRHYSTVSEWGRERIVEEKKIPRDRVRVIRPGVDTSIFSPSKREVPLEAIDDIESPRVLYLSRMATRKGIYLLLKAIPRILKRLDAHFLIAGSGTLQAELVPRSNTTFLGQVPMSHPPLLYAKSDVFVLPSLYENLPVCLLESMASGCAVVCSDVGGVREVVDHERTGLVIRPNDITSIETAIIRMIEDDNLRREMTRNAMQSITREFKWESTASQTMAHYQDILDGVERTSE